MAGVSFVHFVGIIIMFHIVFLQLFPLLFGPACSRSFGDSMYTCVGNTTAATCCVQIGVRLAGHLKGEHVIVSGVLAGQLILIHSEF